MVPALFGSALLFVGIYFPALRLLARALVTPYGKADLARRLSAAVIDGMVVTSAGIAYRSSGLLIFAIAGAFYLLLRDIGGRSIGKFCVGLVVVEVLTGRPCGRGASIARNVVLLLPGANAAAVVLEALTIIRDPQGQRLGDRMAGTQVVDGLGARDVVAALHDWWRDFVARLDGSRRRPRRLRT